MNKITMLHLRLNVHTHVVPCKAKCVESCRPAPSISYLQTNSNGLKRTQTATSYPFDFIIYT